MSMEHLDTIIAFVVILAGVSMLVTILTQTASSVLALRGTNLRWGIATLLTELDPNLAAHARTISEKVLHHPLVSDSTVSRFGNRLLARWKLGSTIRKEELVVILHMLADRAPGDSAPRPWASELAKSLEQLDQGAAQNVVLAAPEIKKLFPNDPARAELMISRMMSSAEYLSGSISDWFEPMMDRVSQRFVVHARIWTVVFSFVVAFALHLDALRLLTQLSSDAELRSRLVASSDALVKKADEILVTSPGTTPAAVYTTAMQQLIAAHPTELKALGEPPGFADLAAARGWLQTKLDAAHVPEPQTWLDRYLELVPQASLRRAADDIHAILDDKLKLELIPDPYPTPFYNYWQPSWRHLWGVVASAALLSLGAPFWFNMLKSLASLRPALANKQDAQAVSPPSAG